MRTIKTMHGIKCDECGIEWMDSQTGIKAFEDEQSMTQMIQEDSSWLTVDSQDGEDQRHYCVHCCYPKEENDDYLEPPVSMVSQTEIPEEESEDNGTSSGNYDKRDRTF